MTDHAKPEPRIRRFAPVPAVTSVNSMISSGLLTEEEGMRLLYPEEAAIIYDPTTWPYGAPNS